MHNPGSPRHSPSFRLACRRRRKGAPELPGDRRGVTALEMGLVAPVFLMAILGIFDFAFTMYSAVSLDTGLDMAARQVELGDVTDAAGLRGAVCQRVSGFVANCAATLVVHAVSTTDPQGVTALAPDPNGTDSDFFLAGSGSFALLQVSYSMPHLLNLLGRPHTMVSTILIQLEPFPVAG